MSVHKDGPIMVPFCTGCRKHVKIRERDAFAYFCKKKDTLKRIGKTEITPTWCEHSKTEEEG